MLNNKNKKTFFLILVGFFSVLFFFGLVSFLMYATQALEEKINITITPKDNIISPDTSKQISFIIKPDSADNKVSAANLVINGENVTFESIEPCQGLGGEPSSIFSDLKSDTSQSQAQRSCAIFKSNQQLPSGIKIEVKFKCNNQGIGRIFVNKEKSQITGNISGVMYGWGNVDQYNFNCSGDINEQGVVKAEFDPQECQAPIGKNCNYKLSLIGADPISGYYLKLKYDPSIIKAQSVNTDSSAIKGVQTGSLIAQTPNTGISPTPTLVPPARISPNPTKSTSITPTTKILPLTPALQPTDIIPTNNQPPIPSDFPIPTGKPKPSDCYEIVNKINHDQGEIELLFFCLGSSSQIPKSHQIYFNFSGLSQGQGFLSIDQAEVVGPIEGYKYKLDLQKAKYTINKDGNGGGSGKTKLNLTLRLQGITKKPKEVESIKVRVGIGDGGLKESIFKTVDFKVDDKGLWHGSVEFEAPFSNKYKVLVKGWQHLQKKVCVEKPTENYPGAYSCDKGNISLEGKPVDLDFSKIIMLVGDLHPQDGLCNAYDQALIRNAIGECNTETTKIADVNYDGCINSIDHSLMISALSVRYDDDRVIDF